MRHIGTQYQICIQMEIRAEPHVVQFDVAASALGAYTRLFQITLSACWTQLLQAYRLFLSLAPTCPSTASYRLHVRLHIQDLVFVSLLSWMS